MKDIVITAKRIRRELWMLSGCVILALAVNAGAILAYKTRWIELLTTWHITGAIALGIYCVTGLFRLAVCGARRLLRRRPNDTAEIRPESR